MPPFRPQRTRALLVKRKSGSIFPSLPQTLTRPSAKSLSLKKKHHIEDLHNTKARGCAGA